MQQHVKDVNIATSATQAKRCSATGGICINRNDQTVTTYLKNITHFCTISVPCDLFIATDLLCQYSIPLAGLTKDGDNVEKFCGG